MAPGLLPSSSHGKTPPERLRGRARWDGAVGSAPWLRGARWELPGTRAFLLPPAPSFGFGHWGDRVRVAGPPVPSSVWPHATLVAAPYPAMGRGASGPRCGLSPRWVPALTPLLSSRRGVDGPRSVGDDRYQPSPTGRSRAERRWGAAPPALGGAHAPARGFYSRWRWGSIGWGGGFGTVGSPTSEPGKAASPWGWGLPRGSPMLGPHGAGDGGCAIRPESITASLGVCPHPTVGVVGGSAASLPSPWGCWEGAAGGGGGRSGHRWETGEGGREPVAAGGFQHRGGAGPPWGLCGSGESRLRCGEQWVPGGCGCVAGGESSPEPGFKAVPAAEPQGSLPCPAAIRPGAACPPGCVPPPQQRMGSWVPCSCAVG